MPDRPRVLVVYGTRPEAIKLAPVVRSLRASTLLDTVVSVTGQHRQMLDQVHAVFGFAADHDLDLIKPRQKLPDLTMAALGGLSSLIEQERPSVVLVQGDTTTAFAGALAAFYQQVPVVHLEAGLRTADIRNPFPEEANRRLVTRLTDLHLAPTPHARADLEAEGVDPASIVVSGNTVIDALLWAIDQDSAFTSPELDRFTRGGRPLVLVTAHRRESWGAPMAAIASAVAGLARSLPDIGFVLPAHLNPVVRETLLPPLAGAPNVLVTDPVPYVEFCRLMALSDVILTDSGGVQEEAPSLGKPVLVMRDTTERPEGVEAGVSQLVGTDVERIQRGVIAALAAPRRLGRRPHPSPYGDGRATERAVAAISDLLGVGARIADYDPAAAWPR